MLPKYNPKVEALGEEAAIGWRFALVGSGTNDSGIRETNAFPVTFRGTLYGEVIETDGGTIPNKPDVCPGSWASYIRTHHTSLFCSRFHHLGFITTSSRPPASQDQTPKPLRARLKIGSGAAAWDFGFGRGGTGGASPQRAVTPVTIPLCGTQRQKTRRSADIPIPVGIQRCLSIATGPTKVDTIHARRDPFSHPKQRYSEL
jgi:hypothetical protein